VVQQSVQLLQPTLESQQSILAPHSSVCTAFEKCATLYALTSVPNCLPHSSTNFKLTRWALQKGSSMKNESDVDLT
jgi:hypothetical protein